MLDIPTFFAPYWLISYFLCRGGAARAKLHHARLNWDRLSATQKICNLLLVEDIIFAICDLAVSVFGIVPFYDVFQGYVYYLSFNQQVSKFLNEPSKVCLQDRMFHIHKFKRDYRRITTCSCNC